MSRPTAAPAKSPFCSALMAVRFRRPALAPTRCRGEFYAFDILVSDGENLRGLPLSMRKASLSRLLARRADGIFLSDFEHGEIGPDLFRHACLMGLEGMVRSTATGRSLHWVKVKNCKHPAMQRVMDTFS